MTEMAACVAFVTGAEPGDVPADPAGGWRRWLAGRGLGLVPVADAEGFSWAGFWLATGRRPGGSPGVVVMFGVPSGVVFDPAGDGAAPPAIEEGFVVARLDLRDTAPLRDPGAGVVEGIYIAPEAEAPMTAVARATVTAEGVEGDRYFRGAGTFSAPGATGGALTLVDAGELDALDLSHGDARRNVVTRGIDLNALVGRRFTVGGVECYGQRLCEPCAHLQRLARPGILRPLVHRAGLRADVLAGGTIEVGATVRPA